jgi:uncharacterized membrane protein YidH (DUF202 family)
MVHFGATAEQQGKACTDEAVGASSFKTISHLLEECRMVLPGIQALFGFQLIAVFNQPFWDRLDPSHRSLHFIAIFLVVISMALVMTPAAYHRQAKEKWMTQHFIALSSRLLLWSMFPLMMAICVDVYLIATMIFQNRIWSLLVAMSLLGLFFMLWILLPRSIGIARSLAQ